MSNNNIDTNSFASYISGNSSWQITSKAGVNSHYFGGVNKQNLSLA